MKKRIRVICTVLTLTLMLAIPASAVNVSVGYAGINTYNYCSHGDRAGATYGIKLQSAISNFLPGEGHYGYVARSIANNSVTVSALKTENDKYYTLFAYAGHGLKFSTSHNSWHVNYYNGTPHSSLASTHNNSNINFTTANAKFKHNYVIAYTCNFLTNGGSTTKAENILKTMNGTRLICGFASTMFVHSDEATEFARVAMFQSVRSAYINAAWIYQTYRQKGMESIIRVVGHWDSYYERIYAGKGQQVPYNSATNKSQYGILQTEYAYGR